MRKITHFMQLMIIILVSLFATTNLKAQSHFVFEGGNPADPVYTIYFFGATLNGVDLQAGDEIAVYDGTKMVGAAVLTSVCASENYNNFVSAFKTLTSGTGYVPGHPVTFKCWDASAGVEATDFTINYLDLYGGWIQSVFPSEDGVFAITEANFTHATNIPVTGVALDPSTLNLIVNETGQLTATISPENATNQLVAWSTTNNSVATVDQTGLVTASGTGTAKIVVTTDDGGFTDTCYVTVSAANIPVSGVTIQPTTMNLYVAETGQLTETVVPPDATNKNVTWSSTNEAIATVNATGLVTAVSEGVAKVAVTTVDGGFSDTCTVTVSHVPIAPVLVSAVGGDQQVTLTWTPVSAKKGRTTTHFNFEGGNAADPVYTLYFFGATLNSMNLEAGDEIAVYDGAKMVGATVLTSECAPENYNNFIPAFATLTSGPGYTPGNPVSFKCWDASAGIECSEFQVNYLDLYDGWTQNVFPGGDGIFSFPLISFSTVVPYQPTYNVYHSDGTLIASDISETTYTESGLTNGTEYCYYVTQILESTNESDPSNTLCATPESSVVHVTGVTVSPDTLTLLAGATGQLIATVLPVNATNPNVIWSSANQAIATVNASGLVTAVAEGSVYIKATTEDGGFADSAYVIVNHVIAPVLVNAVAGNQQVTLTWTPVSDKKGRTTHFNFEGGNAADPVYTFYFFGATLDGLNLEPGDEIAAYDGTTMVGAITLSSICAPDNFDNDLPAFATLNSGPGFTPGNPVSFKCWDASAGIESSEFQVNYLDIYDGWTQNIFPEGDGVISFPLVSFTTVIPYQPTFNVYHSDGTVVASGISETTYTESGLTNGTEYCYYVTQIMEGGSESAASNTLCATPFSSYIPVTGISVTPDTLSVNIGLTGHLTATIQPLNATNQNVTWSSANQSIATVNTSGLVTAIAEGSVYIKATTEDGGFADSTYIIVTNFPTPVLISAVAGDQQVSLTWLPIATKQGRTSHFNFEGGNAADPVYTFYFFGATLDGLNLESGDEIAAYDGTTMVGAVTLNSICAPENFDNSLPAFATLNSGPGWVSGHPVSFKCWDASTGIESSIFNVAYSNPYADPYCFTENIFPPADGYYSLPVIEFTGQGYQPTFNVYHSNGAVVAAGVASTSYTETGLTNGTEYCYYVTQVLDDGSESPASNTLCATPQLPVIPVTGILVMPDTLNLNSGETGQMTAYIDPPNATNPSVTWSSANTDIATVDATGLVSAIAQGEVYIKATANDGGLADSSLVIVNQFIIAPTLVSAIPGCEKITLTWTPANVTKKDSKLVHFNFQGGDPSDYVYTFYLFGAQLNGINLEAGDEIAVFDGNKMVGAKALTSVCSPDNYNNFIPAFKTLTSEPGYTPGNPVSFRCWDASEGIESSIFQVNYANNGDPYCFTQNIFPSGDGYYCLSDVSFTGISYNPVYNLYYSNGNLVIGGLTDTTFVNEGLVTGTEYCYYVTQILPDGSESVASNILCATPGIDLPGAAGAITGTSIVCQGQTNVQYSVAEIEKAEGYNWILPEGASIVSGGNTNAIVVNYSNSSVSGNITVRGTNGCGNGPESPTFAVMVNPLPGTPGTITGQANVCLGQAGVVYTVPPIANATGYVWSVPAGVTIVSGSNTNSITVDITQSAVSGNITVYGTNTCGNGVLSQAFALTISTVPGAAGNIAGLSSVCQGQNAVAYSVQAIANATGYVWTIPTGATIASGANTNSILVNFSASAVSGNFTVYGTNDCGNGQVSPAYAVTVNPTPGAAGNITGPATVCQGQNAVTYSVATIANATGYVWTVPAGATIVSGANTNSIIVNFSSTAASGNFTVYGTNNCGNGTISPAFAVTVNSLPGAAGNITGPSIVNQGQTGVVYSVAAIANATGYVWTVPTGATIVSGANTNSITVNFSNTAVSGNFTVYGTNDCGNGTVSPPYAVTVNPLNNPTVTIGTLTNVVAGAFALPVNAANIINMGAFQFTIEFDPALMEYVGTSNWYPGIDAITVGYPSPGHITFVWAAELQGITILNDKFFDVNFTWLGSNSTSPVIWSDNPTPREFSDWDGNIFVPTYVNGSVTGISGQQPILSVTPDNQNVTSPSGSTSFAVANVGTGTMTYTSAVTTGGDWLTITSGGSGGNTGTIAVAYTQNTSSVPRVGTITVTASGAIGSPKQVTVTQEGCTLPGAAGTITGPATVCQGQNGAVYSVATIANATGYVWTVPSGATIVSGNNTNSITVDFSNTATSGSFTVYGTNGCGNGTVSPPYAVTVNPLPGAAGTITGPATVCQGQNGAVYSVATIANATGYVWTVPSGATIVSGNNTNSITVNFSNTATSGSFTVYGTNGCGNGTVSPPYVVTVNPLPGAAGTITGPATVCQGQNGAVYSVATIANATGYVWTVPSGATIVSGNNTNSITVNFSNTATSGSFTVYGTNGCGNGTVSPAYAVTVDLLPDTAGTPIGPDSVCYNHTPTSDYTTSGATNATSYLWSISPAAAGTITGTGLTATVTWSEWIGNASITVTGVNDCGEGTVSAPMVVNVDLCPGIPEQFINKLQVNVFPNPSDGRFNIELTSDKNITFNLSVHNMIGETVLVERNIRFTGYYLKTMDLNNLNNGVYFVYLESNEGLIIKKITIQH